MLIPTQPESYKDATIEQPAFDRLYIPAKIIKAAKVFQAKQDVRYYLKGIHFDPRGHIEATNGYMAIRIECEECKRLPKKMILNIKGAKIPAKADMLEIVSMNDKRGVVLMRNAKLSDMDDVRSFEVVSGNFPDIDRVIPKSDLSPIDQIGLNAEYLKDIAEAQKILSHRYGGINLKFRGPSSAIEVEFHSNDDVKAKVILMPMRF